MCQHNFVNAKGETLTFGYDYQFGEWYYQRYSRAGSLVADEQPADVRDITVLMNRMDLCSLLTPQFAVAFIMDMACCVENHNNITTASVTVPGKEHP